MLWSGQKRKKDRRKKGRKKESKEEKEERKKERGRKEKENKFLVTRGERRARDKLGVWD